MMFKILCLKPKAKFVPFSWLIRAVQMTDYSHMAIQYGQDVLDCTIDGVKFTHQDEYRKKYKIVYEIRVDVPNEKVNEFYFWAAKYRDVQYGIVQNIGTLFRMSGIYKSNPFGKNEHQLVCSELVAIFMRDFLGAEINDSDDYDLINAEFLARRYEC